LIMQFKITLQPCTKNRKLVAGMIETHKFFDLEALEKLLKKKFEKVTLHFEMGLINCKYGLMEITVFQNGNIIIKSAKDRKEIERVVKKIVME